VSPFGFEEHEDDDMLIGDAEVVCPYCGESMTIAVDPTGGAVQEYVEDCQVCCQPWHVHVRVREDGVPDVWLEAPG
jgi:hypothetical protein